MPPAPDTPPLPHVASRAQHATDAAGLAELEPLGRLRGRWTCGTHGTQFDLAIWPTLGTYWYVLSESHQGQLTRLGLWSYSRPHKHLIGFWYGDRSQITGTHSAGWKNEQLTWSGSRVGTNERAEILFRTAGDTLRYQINQGGKERAHHCIRTRQQPVDGDIRESSAKLLPNLAPLKAFLGKWHCTGSTARSAVTKKMPLSIEMTTQPVLGGAALLTTTRDINPRTGAISRALTLWSYDSAHKHFASLALETDYGWVTSTSTGWTSNTLQWSGVVRGMAVPIFVRQTLRRADNNRYSILAEAEVSRSWRPVSQLTCERAPQGK